jgi:hypothetical protein
MPALLLWRRVLSATEGITGGAKLATSSRYQSDIQTEPMKKGLAGKSAALAAYMQGYAFVYQRCRWAEISRCCVE